MSLISVIVPMYKVEAYLPACLDSLLAQTHRETEFILVDDGSPDASGTIAEAYAARDSRVRVLHQANGGLSSARNAGIDAARGEYLAFIDSDDWVDPEMLETMLTVLEKTGAGMALCGLRYEYEDGRAAEDLTPGTALLDSRQALERLCAPKAPLYVIACDKLYGRACFDGVRFPEGRLHEDEFTAHRLLRRAGSVATVDAAFYHYRIRESSITGDYRNPRHLDGALALADRYEELKAMGLRELLPLCFGGFMSFFVSCLRDGEWAALTAEGRLQEARRLGLALLKEQGGGGLEAKERLALRRPRLWKMLYAIKGRLTSRGGRT